MQSLVCNLRPGAYICFAANPESDTLYALTERALNN